VGWLTVLTDEEKFAVAVGIGPEPAFGAVIAGATFRAARKIPERYSHIFSRKPFPVCTVSLITHQSDPILTARIVTTVPAPEFPADESLQGRIRLVDKGPTARFTELTGFVKVERLVIVEEVALAVIRGAAARHLVTELRTPLDGQRLLTDRHRQGKTM